MIAGRTLIRLGTLVFGAALVLGAGTTAYAQGGHDHRKQEKRAEKRHQKAEKEALKRHQRDEREHYGNDREVREHQRQEREELKRHRRDEKRQGRDHRRDERDGRYDDRYDDRNDGYYGDGGYSNSNRQAVLEAAYREGLRAGRDDRSRNRQYDLERHQAYRNASGGNRGQYGDAEAYREGFRRGYDEGYRDDRYRTNSGGGWGDILGGILGRP